MKRRSHEKFQIWGSEYILFACGFERYKIIKKSIPRILKMGINI
jgi:hypothetical protein